MGSRGGFKVPHNIISQAGKGREMGGQELPRPGRVPFPDKARLFQHCLMVKAVPPVQLLLTGLVLLRCKFSLVPEEGKEKVHYRIHPK